MLVVTAHPPTTLTPPPRHRSAKLWINKPSASKIRQYASLMAAFCAVIPKAAHHDVIHQGWVEAGLAADELGYEQFRKMAEKCTFYRSVQDETVLRYWWRSVELLAPTFWENSELKEVSRGQGEVGDAEGGAGGRMGALHPQAVHDPHSKLLLALACPTPSTPHLVDRLREVRAQGSRVLHVVEAGEGGG